MITISIKIDIPFDERCEICDYIKYNSSSVAFCNIFFEQLFEKNGSYVPCIKCITKRDNG